MKMFTSLLTLIILSVSSFAQANPIKKACYQEQSIQFGPYVVEISVYPTEVYVNYKSKSHGSLGGYRGRILSSSDLIKEGGKLTVKNLTLNDGADGYLDGVKIEITRTTVNFESRNSSLKNKPQVKCD